MKKVIYNILPFPILIGAFFLSLFGSALLAQQPDHSPAGKKTTVVTELSDAELKKIMQKDGITDPAIDKLLAERKIFFQKYNATITSGPAKKKINPNPIPFSNCTDLGVEAGWSSWQGAEGTNYSGNPGTLQPPVSPPVIPRFNITTGSGIDPCTPGTVTATGAPGPPIPVVAPGFGSASIQLGQTQSSGGMVEELKFTFTPTTQDVNLVYAYAAVLYDPESGHAPNEKPYVEFKILNASGTIVPCSYQRYVSDPQLPGWYTSKVGCGWANTSTFYKPWTVVGVDLSAYIGQPLTCVINNNDCTQGGHFAHSYWDFQCGPVPLAGGCIGKQSTIVGPASNPYNPYSYQWYRNGNPMPGDTLQNITVTPVPNDTFLVAVSVQSGCNFSLTYIPVVITPDFNITSKCDEFTFMDSSFSTPVTSSSIAWNWNFPGGTPATATSASVSVTYPPGNYTASLTITSSAGCMADVSVPFSVGNVPVAAFGSTPGCMGETTLFTDSSVVNAGDPFTAWDWNFGDGSSHSSVQNPTHVYPSGGTYSVTLAITTQNGCVDSITKIISVNPSPVAAFSTTAVCFNNPTVLTDLSTGSPTQWSWDLGDGFTSTTQNPTHTYVTFGTFSITLIVTSDLGCTDTMKLTTRVNPLPAATFSFVPVCSGIPTCFTDASTVIQGGINAWSWNFGDIASGTNNTSSLQNPCHTFNGPGPFSVILTVTSDSGCQNTITRSVNVNPPPIAGINAQNVCLNSNTNFSDGSVAASGDPISSWDWDFADGSAHATVKNPSHTYSASGTYNVVLIIISSKGCKDTVINPVSPYKPPVANFSDSLKGCSRLCQTFTNLSTSADGTIASLQWKFTGGTPALSAVASPTVCWTPTGKYDVELIVTSSFGCKDTLKMPKYIEVYARPDADFSVSPAKASALDPSFYISDMWSSNVSAWNYDFGDNTNDSINTDPAHTYSTSITSNDFYSFNICLQVETPNGCIDTVCKKVEVIPEYSIYFPNTFTPNMDGNNEMFFGKGSGIKEYEISIFDRYGNLIWNCKRSESNTLWDGVGKEGLPSACQWDGKVVKGGLDMSGGSKEFAQEDVYVWKATLLNVFDKRLTFIGHVNIVR